MNKIKIDSEIVEELHGDPGENYIGWECVADVDTDNDSRWYARWQMVLRRMSDNTHWAVDYEVGLTESQETTFPWAEAGEVDAYRVVPQERTVIEWVAALSEATDG